MPETFQPSEADLFQRFAHGTSGTLVPVVTNYFFLNFEPAKQMTIHKYRVDIDFSSKLQGLPDDECSIASSSSDSGSNPVLPSPPPVLKRNYEKILDKFLEEDPRFKVDQTARCMPLIFTLYDIGKLGPPVKVSLDVEGKTKDFYVKLYNIKEGDIVPANMFKYYSGETPNFPEGFASLNRAVLNTAMDRTFFKDRNRFYDFEDRSPADKMDFVQGFTGTVRNSELGPILNMHLKTGIIISERFESMAEVYLKFLNTKEGKCLISFVFSYMNSNLYFHFRLFTTQFRFASCNSPA